jgi:hypothetical protein
MPKVFSALRGTVEIPTELLGRETGDMLRGPAQPGSAAGTIRGQARYYSGLVAREIPELRKAVARYEDPDKPGAYPITAAGIACVIGQLPKNSIYHHKPQQVSINTTPASPTEPTSSDTSTGSQLSRILGATPVKGPLRLDRPLLDIQEDCTGLSV